MRTLAIAALLAAAMAVPAGAEEQPVQLKDAPGLDKVEANCAACHSLDYVQMNSPFPSAKVWDATVTKMIKALRRTDRRGRRQNHPGVFEDELRELRFSGTRASRKADYRGILALGGFVGFIPRRRHITLYRDRHRRPARQSCVAHCTGRRRE